MKINFSKRKITPKILIIFHHRTIQNYGSGKHNMNIFSGVKLITTFSLLLASIIAAYHLLPYEPIVNYTITYLLGSFVYLILSAKIFRIEIHNEHLIPIIVFFLLVRISFVNTTPSASDDIYRYMWDGKVQASGINPYEYKPGDPKLSNYHSELLPAKVNFPEMRTIYFPLSEWLFFTGFKLSGENIWGYKLLLLLAEIITFVSLYFLLKKKNINLKYLLFYVLCPLPIFQFALDAHVDGFGLPLFVLALTFYSYEKKFLSALFLGLSLSIKPVGIVLLPIFFLNEEKLTSKIKFVLTALIAFAFQFLPYIFTSNPFEAFLIYTKHWIFNGFVFNLFNSFIHNNQTTRIICTILLSLSLLPLYFSKKNFTDKIYYAVLLLMIFSPVVHPWYIAWLVVLLPLTQKWSGLFYAAFSSLTIFTILNYQLHGMWKEYWVVLLLEYVPVIVLMITEMMNKKLFYVFSKN
ncbi:MAG: hypothetical protein HYS25_09515 [Ignavibacteriales bacterium]|nr:hypothetical protein [Ignavibacteriales bacterium]